MNSKILVIFCSGDARYGDLVKLIASMKSIKF